MLVGKPLEMPYRFRPSIDSIKAHFELCFNRSNTNFRFVPKADISLQPDIFSSTMRRAQVLTCRLAGPKLLIIN